MRFLPPLATICRFYTDYERLLREGRLSLGDDTVCLDGACAQLGGRLRLTGSTVQRPVLILRRDAYGVWTVVRVVVTLAIACCDRCGSRIRVLLCDILPRKSCSLPIIERAMAAYATGCESLRNAEFRRIGSDPDCRASLPNVREEAPQILASSGGEGLPANRVRPRLT